MSSVVVIGAQWGDEVRKPTLLYVIPAVPTQGTPLL